MSQPIQGQDEEVESMKQEVFIEEIYEIAFGDDAINRYYTYQEVLDRLKEFSEEAYNFEEFKNAL